jgi:predicted NBD/HSP70 family sugar kinase/DNA-binding MarR family transcriptional regulator
MSRTIYGLGVYYYWGKLWAAIFLLFVEEPRQSMTQLTSIEDVKSSNRKTIIEIMRGQSPISRTQLASVTGLSKATVSRILSDMLGEGLVEEVRTTESGVGRPHILLRLASKARYAVGIELTVNIARVSLTDMNARPIKQRIQPVNNSDVSGIVDEISIGIKDIIRDIPASQLVGVGVAIPGTVDMTTGIVSMEYPAGWRDYPLETHLARRIGLPVMVVNQAQAAAWGEKWAGGGMQISELLFIRLGNTVEAGLVIHDRLYFGKTHSAGAIGHMTLNPDGIRCTCGNRGCLNTVGSIPALLANARALLKDNRASMLMGMVEGNPSLLTLDHLMRAVQAGDGLAVQVISEVGRALGVIVASLFNLLNFEKVIIGGPLSAAGNALLSALEHEVSQRALPASLVLGRIEMTRLGADAASIGAASLILQDAMNLHLPS